MSKVTNVSDFETKLLKNTTNVTFILDMCIPICFLKILAKFPNMFQYIEHIKIISLRQTDHFISGKLDELIRSIGLFKRIISITIGCNIINYSNLKNTDDERNSIQKFGNIQEFWIINNVIDRKLDNWFHMLNSNVLFKKSNVVKAGYICHDKYTQPTDYVSIESKIRTLVNNNSIIYDKNMYPRCPEIAYILRQNKRMSNIYRKIKVMLFRHCQTPGNIWHKNICKDVFRLLFGKYIHSTDFFIKQVKNLVKIPKISRQICNTYNKTTNAVCKLNQNRKRKKDINNEIEIHKCTLRAKIEPSIEKSMIEKDFFEKDFFQLLTKKRN